MLKKIILGGIALAATGYGIKKLYEIYDSCTSETKSTQEDDGLIKNFDDIHQKLYRIYNFEGEILIIQRELFIFVNFLGLSNKIDDFFTKYQKDFYALLSQKRDFKAFNEEERDIFLRFVRFNNLFASFAEELLAYKDAREEFFFTHDSDDMRKDLPKFIELESFLKKELNIADDNTSPCEKDEATELSKIDESLEEAKEKE